VNQNVVQRQFDRLVVLLADVDNFVPDFRQVLLAVRRG
jgi:hypothetical protein